MNDLLVAWKPLTLIMMIVTVGLYATGHHGLAGVAAGVFVLIAILALTGNLAGAGLAALLLAGIVTLNFTGVLHYNAARPGCYDGYHWDGPWQTVWAVGRMELRLRQWHCAPNNLFDPARGIYPK